MTDTRPDIVMMMTDQHAARILGAAGDRHADTPALDRLATQGTRFENCYCPAPLCVPSRMAFLTGLEPQTTGVLTNDNYLPSDIPTIAHAMGAAGYDCHLVGRMHFYGPDQLHGFAARPIGDIGASFPGGAPPGIGPLTPGRGNRGPELAHSGAGETSYQAYDLAVADHAERTLTALKNRRKRTGRPFFALVSLFCPHPPYIARAEDYARFSGTLPPPRLPPPETDHPAIAAWRRAGKVDDLTDEAIARSRAGYYGLVRMIDRICGRVLKCIEGQENTVTIYTSDHGECLGERGLWWKSVFYDESAKVPLIVRGPGIAPDAVDRRVVSLMDLSATLLDLAGAAPLPGQTGRSLMNATDWQDRCTASYYGGLMNIAVSDVRHRMLRRGDLKLTIHDGAPPQLFDLGADPDELHDLAGDPEWRDRLDDLIAEATEDWDAAGIAEMQKRQAGRVAVIRDWVRRTAPPEPMRWRDPQPGRNRYE